MESSREQGANRQNSKYVDIWRLKLEANSTDFVRLTRWGDYDGYKASNPVVSPTGNGLPFNRLAARILREWVMGSSY